MTSCEQLSASPSSPRPAPSSRTREPRRNAFSARYLGGAPLTRPSTGGSVYGVLQCMENYVKHPGHAPSDRKATCVAGHDRVPRSRGSAPPPVCSSRSGGPRPAKVSHSARSPRRPAVARKTSKPWPYEEVCEIHFPELTIVKSFRYSCTILRACSVLAKTDSEGVLYFSVPFP